MTVSATLQDKQVQTKNNMILIVDDEVMNRELVIDFLGEDYQTASVGSGQAALDYLAESPCDLVLLDINMPGMDGYEVLERLRQSKSPTDLPVIILSALSEPKDIIRGLNLGANDYVTKPISPAVVQARIQTQLALKNLVAEHEDYIQRLEAAEKLRTRLSQIASHDLKNPLNNLRIAHTLLRDALKENPKMQAVVEALKTNVETMNQVIDDFLDMVALQDNSIKFNIKTLQLRDVVMNVLTQYEIAAANKHIGLNYEQLEGAACGDASRVVQAFSNLVSNAIKYSPPHSQVRLWIEATGEQMRLCVADEGQGIPEKERHLLFQEFMKLSPRPTAGEDSTGLGLWIVKILMQKQGGDAGAYFPLTGGSVFWISLPTCAITVE